MIYKSIRKLAGKMLRGVERFKASLILYFAYFINQVGVKFTILSRRVVRAYLGRVQRDSVGVRIEAYAELHAKINHELQRQKKAFPEFLYFKGFPYQALDILNIFGARPTEIRYKDYGLDEILDKDDLILDIGANCGFMSIYSALRTGCRAVCIDHNEYMLNIGQHVSEYLGLESKINWTGERFQEYSSEEKFTVVFSFAAHWTDDGGYRVGLIEHLKKIHSLMATDGVLVFESHTSDIGDRDFFNNMESVRDHFQWDGSVLLEDKTRELFIMKKISD